MKPVKAYQCNACSEVYDYYSDAVGCCPDVNKGFICSHCGKFYKKIHEAEKCECMTEIEKAAANGIVTCPHCGKTNIDNKQLVCVFCAHRLVEKEPWYSAGD